jgi:hypothetical protein
MGCVLIAAKDLPSIRSAIADLPTRGRRLHFNNEDDGRRRRLLGAVTELPISALVVIAQRRHGVSEFMAREACLARIVGVLKARNVSRLVVESRQDDTDDAATILRSRAPDRVPTFEHRTARDEPVLGLADAVTWASGAGGRWRKLIEPILEGIIEVRP